MNKIDRIYKDLCQQVSDINEHLPILRKYASECDHVTEMGVRTGISTAAFLSARPAKMVSYDINPFHKQNEFKESSPETEFNFIQKDVLTIDIDETDLLFIDTWHTYDQVKQELQLHAGKVKKYIIFHDTVSFGEKGEDAKSKGIVPAINEFIENNPEWEIIEQFENNNGLMVIVNDNF